MENALWMFGSLTVGACLLALLAWFGSRRDRRSTPGT